MRGRLQQKPVDVHPRCRFETCLFHCFPCPSFLSSVQSGRASAVLSSAAARGPAGAPAPKKPRREIPDAQKIRVSFDDIFKSVQDLGASSFTGKDKKKYEAKQLAAIGGVVKHKEKMPLKMWLGVSKARKQREERRANYLRKTGLVTGEKFEKKGDRRREKAKGPAGQPADLAPDNLRGPVMHIK